MSFAWRTSPFLIRQNGRKIEIVVLAPEITYAGEKATQKIVDFANSDLVKSGSDSVVVGAVKAENAEGTDAIPDQNHWTTRNGSSTPPQPARSWLRVLIGWSLLWLREAK
ncbi:MAG: hypothetical protein FJ130_13055 [Deltaproteobacteria bacterium]|nr:hypothetical protein [Deltaproteobacteria bacterium]